jgi:hypothetical protein
MKWLTSFSHDGEKPTPSANSRVYKCSTCGEMHDGLPDIGFGKPDYWFDVPEAERDRRCKLTPDTCEIDGEYFFVRGVIQIPVHDYPQMFGFGVWVSLKKENFQTYLSNYNTADIGPFFGWLCNVIAPFPTSEQIKTGVYFQGNDLRPQIVLEQTEYSLAMAQRDGITLDEACRIAHQYMK